MQLETAFALDLIWGAKAISAVIGVNPRQTFHLLETGQIPAKKVGGRWVADRRQLAVFFLEGDAA